MKLCSHLSRMTDNKHQHNPAEEGCHSVVPPVSAGDGVVKVGVPQIWRIKIHKIHKLILLVQEIYLN